MFLIKCLNYIRIHTDIIYLNDSSHVNEVHGYVEICRQNDIKNKKRYGVKLCLLAVS